MKTVDENENQPRELKFGAHITLRVCRKHPAFNFLYQLLSAINSCQQLITVDENENQPRELKFGTHIIFSVQMKNPIIFFSY